MLRFVYFSLLLQRKDTKRKQTETPFEKGVSGSTKTGGILAFEAKMLHTHNNLLNDPPTKRRVCFLYSVPAI